MIPYNIRILNRLKQLFMEQKYHGDEFVSCLSSLRRCGMLNKIPDEIVTFCIENKIFSGRNDWEHVLKKMRGIHCKEFYKDRILLDEMMSEHKKIDISKLINIPEDDEY